MTTAHVRPGDVETFSFEWGTMKWFVSGEEQALTVQPGFTRHPAGGIVGWTRSPE